jgi:hypothetical protein
MKNIDAGIWEAKRVMLLVVSVKGCFSSRGK